ncbi:MAG: HAD family hydrolase [bacterium]
MVRAIVFDLDGTLVDSRRDITAGILAGLAGVQRRPELSDASIGALVGQPLAEMFRAAAPGLTDADVERAQAVYRTHYARHCAVHSTLYPGVKELIPWLRERVRLGCATTKRPDNARDVLQAFGLLTELHAWRGTSADMRYKPAPDLLLAIAEDLDVEPGEMVYVGDTATDLRAAHAAGCQAAWARWGYGAPAHCRAEEPEHVLDAPAQLRGLLP